MKNTEHLLELIIFLKQRNELNDQNLNRFIPMLLIFFEEECDDIISHRANSNNYRTNGGRHSMKYHPRSIRFTNAQLDKIRKASERFELPEAYIIRKATDFYCDHLIENDNGLPTISFEGEAS